MKLAIRSHAGEFAENKNIARKLRDEIIIPALAQGDDVLLDFTGVTGATQSFIHALISDVIRQHGPAVLDRIEFHGCMPEVRSIISIVIDYMQESF